MECRAERYRVVPLRLADKHENSVSRLDGDYVSDIGAGARGTKGTMPEKRRYPQQTLQDCDVQGANIPAWLYAAARLIFITGATISCLALKMTSRLL